MLYDLSLYIACLSPVIVFFKHPPLFSHHLFHHLKVLTSLLKSKCFNVNFPSYYIRHIRITLFINILHKFLNIGSIHTEVEKHVHYHYKL